MAAKRRASGELPVLRFVLVTLNAHLAEAFERARAALARDLPSLDLRLHIAADWLEDPAAAQRCRDDLAAAHMVMVTQVFQDEMVREILPTLRAHAAGYDSILSVLCATELVQLSRLGRFSMAEDGTRSAWSPISLLKKLKGERKAGKTTGERQMAVIRTLPKLLKFLPGTAQDLRIYFLSLQYWLGGTEQNIANLIRLHIDRYAAGPREGLRGTVPPADPESYPEVGVYHPDLDHRGIREELSALPKKGANGTVGVLVGRSYLLAANTAHYDAVIRALDAQGLRVITAFASGLDARPAIERYFLDSKGEARIEALISLTGFSLVGGPAYNDAEAAQAILARLGVPYLSLQALEFQTVAEWERDARGLNPLQATLQVAIPEIDGATGPLVYGGKGSAEPGKAASSEPVADRVELLARRVSKLVRLRKRPRSERKVAIVLFNFPPNAGNTGSAAYLAVFPSLQRVLASLKEQGYRVELPESAEALRAAIVEGNATTFGAPANVFTRIRTDDHVRRERHLKDIERTWGPAPGKQLTDGASLFVLGQQFGNVFVGVQPAFGWEGDPMRLLFEGNFSPTHAFSAFYRWLREDFGADVALHFGTHGALEFMPGKQVGLGEQCWPDRLISDLPNVYLYASNNSSEGTLAKRRGAATLVSYLTPAVANAGLYRKLAELKSTLERYSNAAGNSLEERLARASEVQAEAALLDLTAAEPAWTLENVDEQVGRVREKLLELEYALIPVGLHVVGEPMSPAEQGEILLAIAQAGRPELELAPVAELFKASGRSDEEILGVMRLAVQAVAEHGARGGHGVLRRAGLGSPESDRLIDELARIAGHLATDTEIPGIIRALDGKFIAPAPGGDLLRTPAVLPTGRNLYGFDPYKVPSGHALREGRVRAGQLLDRHLASGHDLPETVAMVLWGTDNMKSEGTPLATALALIGAVPRFDAVGRLCGARLVPLEQLGRPRVDVAITVSGIFRDLLPLQVRLLAEAALLAAKADEPAERNFIRKHALAHMQEFGVDLETAALRVFGNADGAYGSNVNLLIDAGRWTDEDELAEQFVRRKSFGYGTNGRPAAQAALMQRVLSGAAVSFQNLDSIELGTTDIDQYVESLGGMNRVIARGRGGQPAVYVGDHTGPSGKIRTLEEQVALETRTRLLNPKWYEAQLQYGYEGVRNLAGHVTTTFGWSATGGQIPQWVYTEVTQTFVLDKAMRERLARLNPTAAAGMAQRLLEANDRGYWQPDAATLDALRRASDELDDRLEGVLTESVA
ncbi:MAG: magnesium chelatase subunit H [Gemmatimonadales bacterium]